MDKHIHQSQLKSMCSLKGQIKHGLISTMIEFLSVGNEDTGSSFLLCCYICLIVKCS